MVIRGAAVLLRKVKCHAFLGRDIEEGLLLVRVNGENFHV